MERCRVTADRVVRLARETAASTHVHRFSYQPSPVIPALLSGIFCWTSGTKMKSCSKSKDVVAGFATQRAIRAVPIRRDRQNYYDQTKDEGMQRAV